MKIICMELLSRERRSDGTIIGELCLHGNGGERIQIQCAIKRQGLMSKRAGNGALALEALRQLRRMPEFRRAPLSVSLHAMPKAPTRRRVRLMA